MEEGHEAEQSAPHGRASRRLRSLRYFLMEIAIVTVGVLLALGAQQVAQGLNERRLAREARASVRAELDLDLASAAQRIAEQPCINARLALIQATLDAADEGRAQQPIRYIGRPRLPVIYRQRWEAATAGGRTSLLPTEEQRDFARVHAALDRLSETGRDELAAWARLRALEGVRHPSAETLARAREALSEARSADYGIRRTTESARVYASRIGISGKSALFQIDQQRVPAVCLPASTRRGDVETLTGDITGAP